VLIPDNEKCSFSVAENELNKLDFGKVLYFVVFLRQVATGHFVDLTPLGIFFNLL
jgi:hypothetical protein